MVDYEVREKKINVPYFLKFDMANEIVYKFKLTDPLNRYLLLPDTPQEYQYWFETLPLKTDFFCKEKDKDKNLQYFQEKNLIVTSLEQIIVSKTNYFVHYQYEKIMKFAMEDLYINKKDEPYVVANMKLFSVYLPDISKNDVSPCNTFELSRYFNAYANFKNIKSILINNNEYLDPAIFTYEAPFHLKSLAYDCCYLIVENPSLPIEFAGILYNLNNFK